MKKLKELAKNISKNVSTKQAFVGGLVGIVVLVGLGFLLLTSKFYLSLPLPVAKVNGDVISFVQYNQEYSGYKFFMTNTDVESFDEERAKKDVLSRLMVNSIIENLLEDYRGEITSQEINDILPEIFAERTEEEFFEQVKTTYDWDRDDFVERVVVPSLVQDKLIEFITVDEDLISKFGTGETEYRASHIFISKSEDADQNEDSKKLLQEMLVKINADSTGENFKDFAGTLNQDQSIETGGDIGWFLPSDVSSEFGTEVLSLGDQEVSQKVIETEFGFHIVKATGERSKIDIDAYISEQIKDADVQVYWGFPNPLEDERLAE